MKNEFGRLLDELAAGREAVLRRTAEGVTYTRVFAEPERLILLGAGHVSQAVAELAVKLDFAVTVADDRAAFANRERFPAAAEIVVDDLETFISTITRELMNRIRESNARNESSGGAVIACGMARYQGDRSVSAVFDRADERMYENKKDLKLSF